MPERLQQVLAEFLSGLCCRTRAELWPLVDTPVTVIERSLGTYEAQTGQADAGAGQPESSKGSRSSLSAS